MILAEITDGVVRRIVSTGKMIEGYTILPPDHQLMKGDRVEFFTKDYKRLPKPEAGENERVVWEGGWEKKPDYTGKNYYRKDTKEHVAFSLGEVPDDTVTDQEPLSPEAFWNGKEWELPLPEKEEQIRMERNGRLSATDYLIMPDYPISVESRTKVEVYRQSLRDVTSQKGFPDEVVWPEKPEV